ncbi:MAG: phage tail protein [Beijerinckiaceae bacterium]
MSGEVSEGHLLPTSSTPWERNASLTIDPWPRLRIPAGEIRGVKLRYPPVSYLPFLIWEYGLGPVSRFHADPRDCLALGVPWARVRGTQDAIDKALDWLAGGYEGQHEAFPPRRRRWNNFHLSLNKLRDVEEPDLNDIEYLTQQSVAERSRFWRGFFAYDVRALDYGYSRWGQSIWGDSSGARIREGGAKWSFGRVYERAYVPDEDDLTALGVWISEDDTGLGWGAFTWEEEGVTWTSSPAATRSRLMASGVRAQSCWIRFRDEDDEIIGHRRARIFRGVAENTSGVYLCDGVRYAPATSASKIYIEALTDFGDGYGSTAAQWSLLFGSTVVSPAKPGIQWAQPGQLSGGVEIMPTACEVEFGRTVRERFKACLSF